jgi:peptidoglycan/LPS O-acetylase OafA/YrhL
MVAPTPGPGSRRPRIVPFPQYRFYVAEGDRANAEDPTLEPVAWQAPDHRPRFRYLPALDGLRAFAVLAVMCYHGGMSWALGGFLGVDAFFVLSGFLITSLLLAEWRDTGGIALAAFWIRRAKRLLPALFLLLAGIALYATFAATPLELGRIRSDGLASLAYVTNWRFVFSHQSYFDQFGVPSPLRHMWSLAIEEQFYLVWPMIVYGMLRWRKGSVGALAIVSAAIGLGSIILMVALYNPATDPSRVYYGTDTRASSLIIGALLAMLATKHTFGKSLVERRVLHGVAILAVGALGWMWSSTTDGPSWLYTGGFVVAALLVALVIADVSQEHAGPVAKVMSWRPLRWIGAISYGLYLWHWPLYVLLTPARTGLDDYGLFAVRVGATFAVATASYYLVERPIRTGSWRGWSARLAAPALAAGLAVVLLVVTAGAVNRNDVTAAEVKAPKASTDTNPAARKRPARLLLVGDSVADSMAPGLAAAAAARGFQFASVAVPGCGLASDTNERRDAAVWTGPDPKCLPPWRERWASAVATYRPDVVIMETTSIVDRRVNGNEIPFDSGAGLDLARSDVRDAIDILGAGGATVVLPTRPYSRLGWPVAGMNLARSGFNDRWMDLWNQQVLQPFATDPRVKEVDFNGFVNPQGVVDLSGRPDGVHFDGEAANRIAMWLVSQLDLSARTTD